MAKVYNYKKLLSEKNFLKVHQRARKLQATGSQLFDILYDKGRVVFKTRSATDPLHITYTQTLDILECVPTKLANLKYTNVKSMLMETNLKIHCNCPAFHYWGYKYMAWKKGYGIQKETRFPKIRNPHERGYVCKHLYFVLQVLPFISSQLASKLLRNANKQEVGELKKDITARYNRNVKNELINESGQKNIQLDEGKEDRMRASGELGNLSKQYQQEFGLRKNDKYNITE